MICSWSKTAAAAAFLALALALPAAAAGPVVVKMATLAPEGSGWYKVLSDLGDEWKKISGGGVTLRIYPGGVVGDEMAMLRKIKVGQLQAAAITGMGLASVDRSFYALSIPMFYDSYEEFAYVRDRAAPMLEQKLGEKGFVLLFWGDAGWVYFFAKRPFVRPSDVKAMKLYVGEGDEAITQIYKGVGFNPVPLSIVDILPGLQTGLIDAFNATPLAALAFQWFALSPNTIDLKWAALPGATIVDRRTWEKIPPDVRGRLLEASRAAGRKLLGEIRKLNDDAMKVMTANGLKVAPVPAAARAEWRKLMEDVHPRIRGSVIPAQAFDAVRQYRDEYRSGRGRGKDAPR